MCHLRGVGGQANGADSAPSSSPLGHPQGHRRPRVSPPLPFHSPVLSSSDHGSSAPLSPTEQAHEGFVGSKSQHCFSSTQRLHWIPAARSEAHRNLFSCFWEREMSPKPPVLLLPPTLQLAFSAHLLPQVIVLNSGMTSWTVRPYFFIALCFLCILSTAQNAGGTCCVHTLCVFSVLFLS